MPRKRRRTTTAAPARQPSSTHEHRVDDLIVVRESDVSDKLLMLGMLHQTLLRCEGIPGVARAEELGLLPLLDPTTVSGVKRRSRSHRMVLFSLEGTLFLYAMGSAAKTDAESSANDYADFLLETLRTYRPRNLRMASITRLLRSTALANAFEEALAACGTILHAGHLVIDVTEFNGRMTYQILAGFAAFERDQIVLRTIVGRIASARRGELTVRPDYLPFGYHVVDGCVRPDPDKREQVQMLLGILARDGLSARQMAGLMSAAGIVLPRKYGLGATNNIGDSRDPKSAIGRMYKWIELYETGVYTMLSENPLSQFDRIGDLHVQREAPDDPGYILIPHNWGLPEGGWADPALCAAVRAVGEKRKNRAHNNGGQGHSSRKPLLGLGPWIDDDGNQWLLDAQNKTEYRLRRRSADDTRRLRGWGELSIDGVLVARIRAAELHRSLAEGITAALSTGVAAQRLQGSHIHDVAGRLVAPAAPADAAEGYRLRIRELEESAARMRQRAASYADAEDAAPWAAHADADHRKARELRAELADLETATAETQQRGLGEEITADAALAARAVAALGRIPDTAPRAVVDAVGTLIRDLRLEPISPSQVRWQLNVVLPVSDGAAVFGPISGTVPVVHSKAVSVSSALTTGPRRQTALEVLAAGGLIPEVLAAIPEWGPPAAQQNIRAHLVPRGVHPKALISLMHCRVPAVRRTVFTALLEHPGSTVEDLEKIAQAQTIEGTEANWRHLVLHTYLHSDHLAFPKPWAARSHHPQRMLDLIHADGGEMTILDLHDKLNGSHTRYEIVGELLRETTNRSLPQLPVAVSDTDVSPAAGVRVDPATLIRTVPCPHCGGAAIRIWRAPEVPRQLLCPDCRRMPTSGSPMFPVDYVTLPAGGFDVRMAWDVHGESSAAQARRASLDAEGTAALSKPCSDCGTDFVPSSYRQRRCRGCAAANRRRVPKHTDD